MGYLKKKQMEIENHLSGSESLPAINGGFLYVYVQEKNVAIASIPSPNLLAETASKSTVINFDDFTDDEGNEYTISVASSSYGVDWELIKYPEDEEILKSVTYEVKYNEY